MKDNTLESYTYGLPPCPLSAQCVDRLDELDEYDVERAVDDRERPEQGELEKLYLHIQTCRTCKVTLARARAIRGQQRNVLHHWLVEAEHRVPATTAQIMQLISREAENRAEEPVSSLPAIAEEWTAQRFPVRLPSQRRGRQARGVLSNMLAVAVVVLLVLGSLGLFSGLVILRSRGHQGASQTNAATRGLSGAAGKAQGTAVPLHNWHHALLVSNAAAAGVSLINYDARSGTKHVLLNNNLPATAHVDGISHDGATLLYHITNDGGQTTYWTLDAAGNAAYFYGLSDEVAGNAIWMPDNRSVLVAQTNGGILLVDTQTGIVHKLLPSLKTTELTFYHQPFLYFIGSNGLAADALYRVNITSGGMPQQVTRRSPHTMFWLSPDGATIYYVNNGASGQPGIISVSSDGTHERYLSPDGLPIGYTADNSLLIMRQVNGKFQVVKPGISGVPDRVMFDDVVPGAVSLCDTAVPNGAIPICDGSIALAPLAGALLVEAGYSDGTYKVWSLDLQTGKRLPLATPAGEPKTQVQLVGWDTIS